MPWNKIKRKRAERIDFQRAMTALRRLEDREGWDEADLNDFALIELHLLERESTLKALMETTWEAYVWTGADTDGNDRWYCPPAVAGIYLLNAVTDLRKDYDEALDELP